MSGLLFEKPRKWSKPRKLSRFSARRRADVPTGKPLAGQLATDEFGLSYELYRYTPHLSRQYVARALEHLGLSKRISPTQQGTGTIPELVVYGGLLARGFHDYTVGGGGGHGIGPRGFVFQHPALGGRSRHGGSVIDVKVFFMGERIAVRVQGKFHALDGPRPDGGAKVTSDQLQVQRLGAESDIDRVVDVNVNFELEHGPDMLVLGEFERILGRTG